MTAEQWDDEWWRIWGDARSAHDGKAAARHADTEMSERHGLRPDEPAVTVVIKAQPYDPDWLAESVLRLARGARGRVRRGRDIDAAFVAGGWFYDVRDLDRPEGRQIVLAGVRQSQPDAFAACEEFIRPRSSR